MIVKIWGARGSLPSPLTPAQSESQILGILKGFEQLRASVPDMNVQQYLAGLPQWQVGGYGGNTPCVSIATDSTLAIIDGGTGIRLLGYDLLRGPCGQGKGTVHIVFTHFHWDHLIGLPFFIPLFIPGNQIHVHAVQNELELAFQMLFKKPFFPVPLANLGAKIHYHALKPRVPFMIGDIEMTPYQLDHPDPCWGYRCAVGNKVYSHCVDTECTRVTREQLGPDLPLYQDVDLMVFDAQYTLMETIEKVNWGHAAASLGLDIAMREGIKKVIFMHHDPASTNEKIAAAEAQARRYYESQLKNAKRSGEILSAVEWSFGYEGQELKV